MVEKVFKILLLLNVYLPRVTFEPKKYRKYRKIGSEIRKIGSEIQEKCCEMQENTG